MSSISATLGAALDTLRGMGILTPCQSEDAELWYSEHNPQRAVAVRRCRVCPIMVECRRAAEDRGEDYHVWGGVDRTNLARQRRRQAS